MEAFSSNFVLMMLMKLYFALPFPMLVLKDLSVCFTCLFLLFGNVI